MTGLKEEIRCLFFLFFFAMMSNYLSEPVNLFRKKLRSILMHSEQTSSEINLNIVAWIEIKICRYAVGCSLLCLNIIGSISELKLCGEKK